MMILRWFIFAAEQVELRTYLRTLRRLSKPFQLYHLLIQRFQDLIADRQPFPVEGLTVEAEARDQLGDEQVSCVHLSVQSRELPSLLFVQSRQTLALLSKPVRFRDSVEDAAALSEFVCHGRLLYHTRSTSATPSPTPFVECFT